MIENIRQTSDDIDWRDNDSFIMFYENNQLFFDNYNLLKEQEDIVDVIQMKIQYISALNAKDRYSKALEVIPHLDFLISLLDENLDILPILKEDRLFYFGALKGNLKDYKSSHSSFSKLIKIDPENDIYKDWYSSMKMSLQYQYLNYISYTGLAIVVGHIMLDLAFDYELDNRIELVGWILMVVAWLGPKAYIFLRKNGYLK